MSISNNLFKMITTTAFGGMLFCCLQITEVTAQSGKEKLDSEQVKSGNKSYSEGESQEMYIHQSEKKSTQNNANTDQVTRDSSGYRIEEQKEIKEEGKSTLSFNIFLYVLDRFREN